MDFQKTASIAVRSELNPAKERFVSGSLWTAGERVGFGVSVVRETKSHARERIAGGRP
jgi:hypothetical protein